MLRFCRAKWRFALFCTVLLCFFRLRESPPQFFAIVLAHAKFFCPFASTCTARPNLLCGLVQQVVFVAPLKEQAGVIRRQCWVTTGGRLSDHTKPNCIRSFVYNVPRGARSYIAWLCDRRWPLWLCQRARYSAWNALPFMYVPFNQVHLSQFFRPGIAPGRRRIMHILPRIMPRFLP